MPSQRSRIELDPAEQRALLEEARVLQTATIGRDGRPHLVPMWFALDGDGGIVYTTYATSQKVRNLQRDSRITALAETGHEYGELRGVMIEGQAELVIGRPEETARVLALVGRKYGGSGKADPESAQARKRCVVRIIPERVRSWDHRRIAVGP